MMHEIKPTRPLHANEDGRAWGAVGRSAHRVVTGVLPPIAGPGTGDAFTDRTFVWRTGMRRITAALIAVLAIAGPTLPAQEREPAGQSARRGPLPPELLREIADIYNAPGTLRVAGSLDIAPERTVTGD